MWIRILIFHQIFFCSYATHLDNVNICPSPFDIPAGWWEEGDHYYVELPFNEYSIQEINCPPQMALVKFDSQQIADFIFGFTSNFLIISSFSFYVSFLSIGFNSFYTGLKNPNQNTCNGTECDGMLEWVSDGSVFQESSLLASIHAEPGKECFHFEFDILGYHIIPTLCNQWASAICQSTCTSNIFNKLK